MFKTKEEKVIVEIAEGLGWEFDWQPYANFPKMVLKTIHAWAENFCHAWAAIPMGDGRLLVVNDDLLLFVEGEEVVARKELDKELADEIVNDFDEQLEAWASFEAGGHYGPIMEAELTLLLADVKKRLWDL